MIQRFFLHLTRTTPNIVSRSSTFNSQADFAQGLVLHDLALLKLIMGYVSFDCRSARESLLRSSIEPLRSLTSLLLFFRAQSRGSSFSAAFRLGSFTICCSSSFSISALLTLEIRFPVVAVGVLRARASLPWACFLRTRALL